MAFESYKFWNKTLLNHFFPEGGNGNPIISLDDNLIDSLGNSHGNRELLSDGQSWHDHFLRSTLLTNAQIQNFKEDYLRFIGRRGLYQDLLRVRNWEQFVSCMIRPNRDLSSEIGNPCNFAILCAILYVGAIKGADHGEMKDMAEPYLGYKPRNFGEFVEDLMTSLQGTHRNFNPNRIIEGGAATRRYINRIKFHIVLSPERRQELVDFIELNKIIWHEEESYVQFVNREFIPSLIDGGLRDIAEKAKQESLASYFKSIFRSDLNYNRDIEINTRIRKDIFWYYKLYFDYDGSFAFSMVTDGYLPAALEYTNAHFTFSYDATSITEVLAKNVQLAVLDQETVTYQNIDYTIRNISRDNHCLYFKETGRNIYYQVDRPQEGCDYLVYVKDGSRLSSSFAQTEVVDIPVAGFTAISAQNCSIPQRQQRQQQNEMLAAAFDYYRIGPWVRAKLLDNYELYWISNEFEAQEKLIPRDSIIRKDDGYCYFRLPVNLYNSINGTLYVRNNTGRTLQDIYVVPEENVRFNWNGLDRRYYINGWGEVSDTQMQQNNLVRMSGGHYITRFNPQNVAKANQLLDILYCIADRNGVVSQRNMSAAVKFVLGFNGQQQDSDTVNRICYALRSLGYIIAYYDVDHTRYENQLIEPHIEKSDYAIDTTTNAQLYTIKGVYNEGYIRRILDQGSSIIYKKPYSKEDLDNFPEYICLPDSILVNNVNTQLEGNVYQIKDSEWLINSMNSLSDFENHFRINEGGDAVGIRDQEPAPFVKENNHGKMVLYTNNPAGELVVHSTYLAHDDRYHPIPQNLSKAYCQNRHAKSVAIFLRDVDGEIDYGKIVFTNGMAIPELFDIAYCDLNIGLPRETCCFVLDENIDRIPSKKLFEKSKIYETNETNNNHSLISLALSKIAGEEIRDFENNERILLGRKLDTRKVSKRLYLLDNDLRKKTLLYFENGQLTAFGDENNVYCDRGDGKYWSVSGTSSKEKLSSVILGRTLTFGDNTSDAPIFEKNQLRYLLII